MNLYLRLILTLAGLMAAHELQAESDGLAKTAPSHRDVTAVNRFSGDRTWLILKKGNIDLLTIPDTPQGIKPKLQDVRLQGDQLAVVVDYDFCFQYQLYRLEKGNWVLQRRIPFHAMNLSRRQRLVLVQFADLTHLTLTYNNGGADLSREKGVTKEGDQQDFFEFVGETTLKNGKTYDFRNGRE